MSKIKRTPIKEMLLQLDAMLLAEHRPTVRKRICAVHLALQGMPFDAIPAVVRLERKTIEALVSAVRRDGVEILRRMERRRPALGVSADDVADVRIAIATVLAGKLNERERRRLRAVDTVLGGASIADAARLHRLSKETVHDAMALFRKGGLVALRFKRLGKRPRSAKA